jgi:glycerol uptake facilitator-like aquaporin
MSNKFSFPFCEFIGSMFLVIAAISPMILFLEVFDGTVAIAVIADAIAVAFVLIALIETFGPICTAYFNPAVSLSEMLIGKISKKKGLELITVQILGGLMGVLITHLMYGNIVSNLFGVSQISRSGGIYIAEIVGTFLLVITILTLSSQKNEKISIIVGFLVGGMILTTSSTMFANPQVTIARMFTLSAAGISVMDGVIFIFMQIIGTFLAVLVWKTHLINFCTMECSSAK